MDFYHFQKTFKQTFFGQALKLGDSQYVAIKDL